MASLFNFFKSNSDKEDDTETLNEIARHLEMQRFMYEDVYDNLDNESKTAYTILAWVCKLRHLYSNVYADANGKHYQRTKFGFFSTKTINQSWELHYLQKSYTHFETELVRLYDKHIRLKSDFDLINDKNEKLKDRLLKKNEFITTVNKQFTSHKIEIARQRQLIKALETEVSSHTKKQPSELSVVKTQLQKANKLVSELTSKVNKLQTEASANKASTQATHQANTQAANKLNAELMSFNRTLTRQVGNLKNELDTLKEELKFAKAAPKLGNMELNYVNEIEALKRKEQSFLGVCDYYFKTILQLLEDNEKTKNAFDTTNSSDALQLENFEQLKTNYLALLQLNATNNSSHHAIKIEINTFEKRIKSKASN
jgi:phage host-nuclease inhibitor protein Gam